MVLHLPAVLVLAVSSLLACSRSGTRTSSTQVGTHHPAIAWQDPIELAAGPAVRGPWRMNESDFRWVDDPTVDIMNRGEIHVAWVDQAQKDVFFQRYDHDGRSRLATPTNVSRSAATFSWLPRVVVPDRDRVYALWQEIIFSGGMHGGEILFARSSDGGQTFSEPLNLSNTKAGDGKGRLDQKTWDNGSLDLAAGPTGEVYVAWTEYEGALRLRRSVDGGETFSEPIHVGGSATGPARAPSIAVAGTTVHVAWALGEDPGADIQIATSTDGARSFGSPRRVGSSEGHSDAPRIAVDPAGTLHLVFAEAPDGRNFHVRYTRLRAGSAEFEPPRRISSGEMGESSPTLSIDAKGRIYVLWERYEGKVDRPRLLAFTYSRDGGEHFAVPATVPRIAGADLGTNGSQQGKLGDKLAVDADGKIAVVNSTFKADRESHVWLLRGRVAD